MRWQRTKGWENLELVVAFIHQRQVVSLCANAKIWYVSVTVDRQSQGWLVL